MLNSKKRKNLFEVLMALSILFLVIKIKPSISPVLDIVGILISPIIIGVFFYYALRPIKKIVIKVVKNSGLASFISIISIIILVSLIIFFGGDIVLEQFQDAFIENQDKLIDYKDYFVGKIEEILPNIDISTKISNNIRSFLTSISSNAKGLFSGISNIGTQVVLVPFVLFYLLKDDKIFKEKFYNMISKDHIKEIKNMLEEIDSILSSYIGGQFLAALATGILMFIGYLIIDMPNALLMAGFSLITSIIPFIGPFLGIIPPLLMAVTINFGLVIKIIILTIIVQQIESNLITPNIMGKKLKLHPLAVIFIVIISVKLLGILGAFIGTPLFLVLITITKTMYSISKKKNA